MSADKLDETLEETFPASDAPANTVETGIRTGEPEASRADGVVDNPAQNRLELSVDGQTAMLVYTKTKDTFTLVHTEVPESLRGRGFGGRLVEAAVQMARQEGRRVVATCPFARAYLREHPIS